MLRSWRTSLGVILAAILTIALGSGVNTAVLSVAYGLLYRPLPYPRADRLVLPTSDGVAPIHVNLDSVPEWNRGLRTLRVAAYAITPATVRSPAETTVVQAALVSTEFFSVMGVSAAHGRVFGDEPGMLAVMSHRLATRLGMDATIDAAHTLTIAGHPFDVVGVLPSSLAFPSDGIDLWLPAESVGRVSVFGEPDARRYSLVGRLAGGATTAQASGDLERVSRTLTPASTSRERAAIAARPLQDVLSAPMRPVLRVFFAASLLVLLVACANVATLLVGRAMSREREMAVRLAIGAAPWRLVRSVMFESLCISGIGSALGLLVALALVRLFVDYASDIVHNLGSIALDGPVLAIAALATVATTLACGAAPALYAAKTDFASAFRETHASSGKAAQRVRGILVVAQITAAIVLLTSVGLLATTVSRLLNDDAGVDPHSTVVAQVMLSDIVGFHAGDRAPLVRSLLSRLRRLPQVRTAGIGSSAPPDNQSVEIGFRFDRASAMTLVTLDAISPGYLEALGVQLRQGRFFTESDLDAAAPLAIVSETAARRLSRGNPLVGHPIPIDVPLENTRRARPVVVGIVDDVKFSGLDAPRGGAIYVPWTALPSALSYVMVRTAGNPTSMVPTLGRLIRAADRSLAVTSIRPLDESMARSISERRLRVVPAAAFALLAVVVALVAVAAVLGRTVAERRRELAIRAALGATPRQAISLVVWYGVRPLDAATFAAAAVFMASAALCAAYVPARRAAHVNPIELLRS